MDEKTLEVLDKIYLTDIKCSCIIGINDWERVNKQEVIINICLYSDLCKPSLSDNINDAIDYRQIKKQVVDMVGQSSFKLIEALASEVVKICISHPQAYAVKVKVEKPGALRYAKTVGVELLRMK